MQHATWTNWGGNQVCHPARLAQPADEEEAVAIVRAALDAGQSVRVAGAGHSFTPIVSTDGVLLDLSKITGVLSFDPKTLRAEVAAGSRLADLGGPLWDLGVSIPNQGDVDVQAIAGAVATGTKGSGTRFGSISSIVRSARLIDGRGAVVDTDENDMHRLRAAQVSLGLLGPMLRLGLQLVPAYKLREENVIMPMSQVFEEWDHLLSEYRHFSFWWMPTDRSAHMYKLGDVPADHCFVKLLREIPGSEPDGPVGEMNRRTDRAYRIYPDGTTVAEFHELEYMVSADAARAAVDVMRDLMRKRFPDEISPLQVRWQKADHAYLSAQSERDSTSISVSGEIGKDYLPFLRAVDEALVPFKARPHWGKLHFLDRERVRAVYPDFERFNAARREFDPDGRFLNHHLAALFA